MCEQSLGFIRWTMGSRLSVLPLLFPAVAGTHWFYRIIWGVTLLQLHPIRSIVDRVENPADLNLGFHNFPGLDLRGFVKFCLENGISVLSSAISPWKLSLSEKKRSSRFLGWAYHAFPLHKTPLHHPNCEKQTLESRRDASRLCDDLN